MSDIVQAEMMTRLYLVIINVLAIKIKQAASLNIISNFLSNFQLVHYANSNMLTPQNWECWQLLYLVV